MTSHYQLGVTESIFKQLSDLNNAINTNALTVNNSVTLGASGSAPICGTVQLSGGSATVNTTAAVTGHLVMLSRQTIMCSNVGHLTYTIDSGVSFTITSTDGSDTGHISWMIVIPSTIQG